MEYYNLIGLNEEPFSSSPNPRYLFLSNEHRECLNRLEIAIRLRRGLAVVLGRIGTGKTTLSRALIQKFYTEGDKQILGLILDPIFPSEYSFMRNIVDLFRIKSKARSVLECKGALETFLYEKGVKGNKTIVLVIDEGQNLTPTFMEALRNLLNFETNDYKLLQLVIFAQLDFLPKLARTANFEDRIATSYMLNPLNEAETREMIIFRLKCSGWDGKRTLFTPDAYKEIYLITRGYPRRITTLCHNCLIEMIRSDRKHIDASIVRYVVSTEVPQSGRKTARVSD